MLPYADDTKSFSVPHWIMILFVVNVLAFIASFSGGLDNFIRIIFAYGTIPARFFAENDSQISFGHDLLDYTDQIGDPSTWASPGVTLFTSMFLHGGVMHLVGNMWFLWLFGDNVEDRLGKLIFPIFYIASGIFADVIHILVEHNSTMPAIGASGAIAGVMGAYIYMFPRSTIRTLIGWGLYFRTAWVPAPIFLGLWFVLQLFGGFAGDGSNVAFMAHIGGFLGGLGLAYFFDKMKLITWYPGDRNYTGLDFRSQSAREIRSSTYTSPISRGPTYTGDVDTPSQSSTTSTGRKRKRRYVWRE